MDDDDGNEGDGDGGGGGDRSGNTGDSASIFDTPDATHNDDDDLGLMHLTERACTFEYL